MSTRVKSSVAETDKWEQVRRLRYGDFLRLFRDRYYTHGFHHFPDDEGGRDDLWLLVVNVSMAVAEPKKKMRHVIEMWAPWMPDDERDRYVEHVWGLDFYERLMTAREIGERLGLTNVERERLRLRQFKPIDMTDEELSAHRKRKNNERRRAKRGRPRAEYLGSCLSVKKPWEAEGVSRSQWFRMRQLADAHDTEHETTRGRNNSVKAASILVASSAADRPKGIHGSGAPVGRAVSDEGREAESHAACSSALRHNLSHENQKSTVPKDLRAALERLKEGLNGR